MIKNITLPLSEQALRSLHAGDIVSISGMIYSARDAAHKLLAEALLKGESLPIELQDQGIYYLGPAPAKPGYASGAAGPTSSYRMDRYTPMLLEKGLKLMIGKGPRSREVIDSMVQHGAVYFAATGGAAALLAKAIKFSKVIAYPDLGTEAIRLIELSDFPAVVAVDSYGVDQYTEGPKAYHKLIAEFYQTR